MTLNADPPAGIFHVIAQSDTLDPGSWLPAPGAVWEPRKAPCGANNSRPCDDTKANIHFAAISPAKIHLNYGATT
jgi:hypothetical protein